MKDLFKAIGIVMGVILMWMALPVIAALLGTAVTIGIVYFSMKEYSNAQED